MNFLQQDDKDIINLVQRAYEDIYFKIDIKEKEI